MANSQCLCMHRKLEICIHKSFEKQNCYNKNWFSLKYENFGPFFDHFSLLNWIYVYFLSSLPHNSCNQSIQWYNKGEEQKFNKPAEYVIYFTLC